MVHESHSKWRKACWATAACVIALGTPSVALAGDVVMIEEHWKLVLGEPEPERCAPQVNMLMSSMGDLDDEFFMFTLNHHNLVGYAPGGMQVQLWRADQPVETQSGSKVDALWKSNETITWTQRLTFNNGEVTFEIVDGSSETWGAFGGQGLLRLHAQIDQPNLNSYLPLVSLLESGVSYGGNRVSSLTLERLEWEMADGERFHEVAPIDVDTDLDP